MQNATVVVGVTKENGSSVFVPPSYQTKPKKAHVANVSSTEDWELASQSYPIRAQTESTTVRVPAMPSMLFRNDRPTQCSFIGWRVSTSQYTRIGDFHQKGKDGGKEYRILLNRSLFNFPLSPSCQSTSVSPPCSRGAIRAN